MVEFLLQESGFRLELEQANNDAWLILEDSTTDQTGVRIEGHHAQPAMFRRAEILIPTEFTFKITSCLITKLKIRICIASALRISTKMNIKLKAGLIVRERFTTKLKSTTLLKNSLRVFLTSATLIKESYKVGLFANVTTKKAPVSNKYKIKKVKELLLKRLKELWDEDHG